MKVRNIKYMNVGVDDTHHVIEVISKISKMFIKFYEFSRIAENIWYTDRSIGIFYSLSES